MPITHQRKSGRSFTDSVRSKVLRKLLPAAFRLLLRCLWRFTLDCHSGTRRKLARPGDASDMNHFIELAQPILPNPWAANKINNFRIASQRVNAVFIQPGQVFSFWHCLGNPTAAKGYLNGRNIVGGKVRETIAGGLCQLSGILYHTALQAGLSIVERHPHSVDLYAGGEPRYSPLGADATVAFGYKDLRLENPFCFSLRFAVHVAAETLTCRLFSEQSLPVRAIDFQCVMESGKTKVITLSQISDGQWEEIERSVYEVAQG